jgi:hypothetical protein
MAFGTWDYVVFVITLIISTAIGMFVYGAAALLESPTIFISFCLFSLLKIREVLRRPTEDKRRVSVGESFNANMVSSSLLFTHREANTTDLHNVKLLNAVS